MSDLISKGELFNALASAQDKGEIFSIIQDMPVREPLNDLAEEIHRNSEAHGWWDEDLNFGEIIALCHSELSEALEFARSGEFDYFDNNGKPDGKWVELLDCVIRIFDYLAHEEADIDLMMADKMNYNKGRPYKHGKKF